jgi:predicted phage terminase large subunit-like protein
VKRDLLETLLKQLPDETLLEGELLRRSLHGYLKAMWHVIEPGTLFLDNWHIGAKCEHLEAVSRGEIDNLIINEPPRMLKSTTVSVGWPTWEWTREPSLCSIFMSYDADLAIRDSLKCRRVIESEWYQARWGHMYQLTGDQNAKTRFENDKTGERLATPLGATGEGGHRVVIDDPHNMREIHSDAKRKGVIDTWREAISTRTKDPRTAFVIIMQRGHERDLSGHCLAEETGWTHLCLPMEYERKRYVFVRRPNGEVFKEERDTKTIESPIGFVDPRTEEGELLFPKRFDHPRVQRLKSTMGPFGVAGQLQQRPSPAGGSIFRRDAFKFYRRHQLPIVWHQQIQSWDMAFKKTDDSSKVAGQVWGRLGANKFLLSRVNKRMSLPESIAAVLIMTDNNPEALAKVIEDKANGPAIMQTLESRVPGLTPWPPKGTPMQSKEARAHNYSIHVEAGNVWLPHPEDDPTIEEFIQQHESCPNGEFWDEIDAAGQAMDYFGPVHDMDELLEQALVFGGAAQAPGSPWAAMGELAHVAASQPTVAPWDR